MGFRNGFNFFHLARGAVEMGENNQFGIRVHLKSFFESLRIHVPGITFSIDKNSFAVFIGDRVDGGVKGNITAEYSLALKRSFVRLCHTIKAFSGELCCQMKRCCAGRKADCIFHSDIFGDQLLYLINIFSNCRYPIGLDGIINPTLFISMHGRTGKPDTGRKRFKTFEAWIILYIDHIAMLQSLILFKKKLWKERCLSNRVIKRN